MASATAPASGRSDHEPLAGYVLTTGAAILVFAASRRDLEFGVFGALGLAIGFIMQRSRFCFTAAFRDLFVLRSGRNMKGMIVGMAIATVGFGLIMANLLPNPRLGTLAPEAHVTTLVVLLAAYLLVIWIESTVPTVGADIQGPRVGPGMTARLREMYAAVFRRAWPAVTGGVLLGIINVFLYTAHMPWRIVGEYSRWAVGLLTVAGLSPGPLMGTEKLSGCALRTDWRRPGNTRDAPQFGIVHGIADLRAARS